MSAHQWDGVVSRDQDPRFRAMLFLSLLRLGLVRASLFQVGVADGAAEELWSSDSWAVAMLRSSQTPPHCRATVVTGHTRGSRSLSRSGCCRRASCSDRCSPSPS